jgi:hypothetical protein
MNYVFTECHMLSSCGSLIINNKSKVKEHFHTEIVFLYY